jgi:hypothetical protein
MRIRSGLWPHSGDACNGTPDSSARSPHSAASINGAASLPRSPTFPQRPHARRPSIAARPAREQLGGVAQQRLGHLIKRSTLPTPPGYMSLLSSSGQLPRTGLLARVSSLNIGGCLNAQKWPLIPIRVRIFASLCRPNTASLSGCLATKGHSDRRGGHIGSCRRTLSEHTGVSDHLRSSRRQNRDRRTSL